MSVRGRVTTWLLVLATLGAPAVLGACAPEPSSSDAWSSTAQRSLEEAASSVATVRLVIEQRADERLWQAYAVTVTQEEEEAVATATDTLDRTQPPEDPSLEATVTEAGDVLDEAAEAVQTAREHLVAGADAATVEDDIARLDEAHAALTDTVAVLP